MSGAAGAQRKADGAPRSVFGRVGVSSAVSLLRLYQVTLSPLLGPSCRFAPSCSEYTVEAIRRHGVVRGSWIGTKRIARCHPFGGHGFDPVP